MSDLSSYVCASDLTSRRPAGHDLGRDRRDCRSGAAADPGPRRRLSVRRHDPDGRDPACCWLPAPEHADAICLALRHYRFRQRTGDPDLHGAIARTHGRADADLRFGDRKSTRLNSSHSCASLLPSSALKKTSYLTSLLFLFIIFSSAFSFFFFTLS